MVDFRTNSERQNDSNKADRVQQYYRQAFENAQTEMGDLKSRMSKLEDKNAELQSKFSELVTTQAESTRSIHSQIETGIAKLSEDNGQMHALIQSAQTEDLKLVEQMDRNHRERLESIVHLLDQKGVSHG